MYSYYCHSCCVYFWIAISINPTCPSCHTQFVEEAASVNELLQGEEDESVLDDQAVRYLALESIPRVLLGQDDDDDEVDPGRWAYYTDQDDDEEDEDEDKEEDSVDGTLDYSEQGWETEEDSLSNTSSIVSGSPAISSGSSAPLSATSSSSSLYLPLSPSSLSSSSLSRNSTRLQLEQQQQRSISSTSHRSTANNRQNGFFRIERLLDMIYQGYSESENEHDEAHQSFMDNLMDIFSDPMETPNPSHSDDLDQCIERLSRRTLLQDNAETRLECTICQEPFGVYTEILQMPCQHEYHTTCISQWLHVNATCPICRCPAIMERSDDTPPVFSLGSLRTRRHSYPSTTTDNEEEDEEETQSDYYEVIDPPPMWARSSSAVSRYPYTHPST